MSVAILISAHDVTIQITAHFAKMASVLKDLHVYVLKGQQSTIIQIVSAVMSIIVFFATKLTHVLNAKKAMNLKEACVLALVLQLSVNSMENVFSVTSLTVFTAMSKINAIVVQEVTTQVTLKMHVSVLKVLLSVILLVSV